MKIVVATNSFKGSLSAGEASEAAADGVRKIFPGAEIIVSPVGDGGEGTSDAMTFACGGTSVEATASDPLGRKITCRYGILPDGSAVIDLAAASGLTLLEPSERNPLITGTFGTGLLILDAFGQECRNVILSVGGSATNDAATGLLSALGYRFLDSSGNTLPGCGASLGKIVRIEKPANLPVKFTVAADVTNPFYGINGAAAIYAPQKGADKATVNTLEAGMRNFSDVVKRQCDIDLQQIKGAGAAGGTAGAMAALADARIISGAEMVIEASHLREKLLGASLLITGEGSIDSQTLSGKAPWAVMRLARSMGIPTLAIAGKASDEAALKAAGFSCIKSVTPDGMTVEEAMKPIVARRNIISALAEVLTQNSGC